MHDKIQSSEVSIVSAHEVEPSCLLDFYEKIYSDRSISLPKLWKWLYRSDFYNKKTPLVLLYQDQVIAHAGMIPFYLDLDGKKYTASWFVDFYVLPEFQRHGLGMLLTRKWMEFSDICVTFCNEKSIGIFKKNGWFELHDTNLNYYFIRPFNLPKFVRNFSPMVRSGLNFLSFPFFSWFYRRHQSSLDLLCVENIEPVALTYFQKAYQKQAGIVSPLRDEDYVTWRFLESPARNDYAVVSLPENPVKIIIKKRKDKPLSQHIDILWVSHPDRISEVQILLATLAKWSIQEGYDYIRHYLSNKEVSQTLKRSLGAATQHPRFAFFSKDKNIFEKLKTMKWHFEMMDSDFEFI